MSEQCCVRGVGTFELPKYEKRSESEFHWAGEAVGSSLIRPAFLPWINLLSPKLLCCDLQPLTCDVQLECVTCC